MNNKLTTPKEVFTHIRDEVISEDNKYICNCLANLQISEELYFECMSILSLNKPENDSFTDYKYWKGSCSWWQISTLTTDDDEMESIIKEKCRFLTHLISKL